MRMAASRPSPSHPPCDPSYFLVSLTHAALYPHEVVKRPELMHRK